MKKYILQILLLFLVNLTFGQSVITGVVKDTKGGTLPGANVYIKDTYEGVSTDLEGKFSLTTSLTGDQILIVQFMGFEPVTKEIFLQGQLQHFEFRLKEKFNKLEAVTITAGSFEAGDSKRAVTFSSLDIASTAGALGDIVGALNTLPGTTPVGESGRLYVRGGSSEESKTFIDGMLVPVPYFSSMPNLATRGRFNPFLFKGTVFNAGGYSAEYGQALSSVLILNTNELKQQDQLNLSLLTVGGDITGIKEWDSGSVTVSASYFNLGPYMSVTKENFDWGKSPQAASNEITFRQKTGKLGMFKLYSNFNQSGSSISYNDLNNLGKTYEFDLENTYYFLNSTWKTPINDKLSSVSGFSYTSNKDKYIDSAIESTIKKKAYHYKSVFNYSFNDQVEIKFGGEYFIVTNKEIPENNIVKTTLESSVGSGFLEANIYASKKVVFRPGIRFEYAYLLGKSNLSPRFSTAYLITKNTQLSLAYGTFYQNPEDQYLSVQNNLDFEKADHYILSFQRSKNKRILRVEAYYKKYKDLVKFTTFDTEPAFYNNNGDGYAYGFEFFLRDEKSIKNAHYWISYSFLDTRRNYRNYPESSVPGFASKHNFSIVYKHWIKYLRSQVGVDFSISSPRYFDDPNENVFNSGRTKTYHGLNINWSYLYRKNLFFFAALTNVLGRENQFGYRFADQPNEQGIYRKEAIVPFSKRFFVFGLFVSFSKGNNINQLDKIN